ncbi:MAG: hypothetical protein HY317_02660 [Acidobacteria bacterium]|nr:hypothetical protein [Acidobacteriota bacterium]
MADSSRGAPAFYIGLGLVAGVFVSGLALFVAWPHLVPPPPLSSPAPPPPTPGASLPPTPAAPPAQAEPPVEEEIVEVPADDGKPPASPAPRRTKPAAAKPTPALPPPPQTAALLAQAQSALADQRYDAAVALFDEILKADPQDQAARHGRAVAQATGAALKRTFVAGVTSAESAKGNPAKVKGFDSGEVQVKRAAEVSGRIEFDVNPTRVKAGDSFSVKVFLLNTGKKDIKINALNVTRVVNGKRSGGPATPRDREIEPRERALLEVLDGRWAPDTNAWALEVQVMSQRGDTYQNHFAWK